VRIRLEGRQEDIDMARREKTLFIRSAEQVRALRTPLRQEIVQALMKLGACTVGELAAELGREPAALYYHVHALAKAGIVVEGDERRGGGRPERMYGLAADRIVIDRSETSKAFLSSLADLQRATLRAAERELQRALEARDDRPAARGPKGAGDSPILLRLASRLKPQDAVRATKMLHGLVEFLAENDDPEAGETYSLTAAFARLVK